MGGTYIDSVETYINRKERILKKSFYPLNRIHYTLDVILKRVFPKVPITKNIYFFITRGRNRALSKAETFGRLYSCGFEVVGEKQIGSRLFFVTKKVSEPDFPKNPTYGPLIRLNRYGKNGEMFKVYKLRTMHAYAEYLQEYVYKNNHLKEGGKFKDDFRITTEGKIFRKFWLDELPMFINLLKGNMKLVGVRPLSAHYFSLYKEELKQKRIKFKPGLIPPFYADMPKTLEEIMDSEMRYLDAYENSPVRTDIRYFFKAWTNIFFKKARSN
jgi:lipopolysaccharide/colanic/teichoic acid biosynthesis glycosyltransferase